ncbi:hypothetical protein CJF31_00002271 [Rutstroemia sp. NJR-2017a BVV2]|nr:hypothetical protein CJF31_00002271 [Rutstroemia sp. NJR-2017a BVV2]
MSTFLLLQEKSAVNEMDLGNKLTHLDNLRELNSLLGRALQVIDREDLKTRLIDQLVRSLHVRSLQSGDDGDSQVHALDGADETLSNSVTSDNTTEDVDEDSSDLGVGSDEGESLLDSLWSSSTSNIEEVGGLAAVKLDDVHGGHGETGSSDVAAQLDEVETRFRGTDFLGIFLGGVAPFEDLLLTELGIVVEAEFGVHGEDFVLLDGVLGVLDTLLAESKIGSDLASDVIGNTLVDVNVGSVNSTRVLLSNSLNIHTSLRRRNDDGSLRTTVHQNSQVELATSELALTDVYGVADTSASTGLLGDELVSDHLVGEHLGFGRGVDDSHSSLQSVVEGALSSSSGENLCLDNHVISTDLLCNRFGLGGSFRNGSLRNSNAVLFPDQLRLRRAERRRILYLSQQICRKVLMDTQGSLLLRSSSQSRGGRDLEVVNFCATISNFETEIRRRREGTFIMVLFSNEDQPELAPYKKETWEEFNAKMNRIQMALAKREAIAEKILAKYPTERQRKTQEEIDADDAYWFGPPGPGNQSIDEDPAFQKFLKPVEERNKKSLRDRILPAKELKASKARDAEEKAASAKRALAAESSDEEEGRSGLGKAKKMKMVHASGKTNDDKAAKPLINKALLAASEPAPGKELINKALLAQQAQEDGDAEGAEVTSKKSKKKKNKSKQKNTPAGDDGTEINGAEADANGETADKMEVDTEAFTTFYSKPLIVSPKNNPPADSEKAYEGEGEQESDDDDDEKSRQEAKRLLKSLRKKEKKQKKREQASKMDVDVDGDVDIEIEKNGDSKPALEASQDANKKHKMQKTKPAEEKMDVDTRDEQEADDAHETITFSLRDRQTSIPWHHNPHIKSSIIVILQNHNPTYHKHSTHTPHLSLLLRDFLLPLTPKTRLSILRHHSAHRAADRFPIMFCLLGGHNRRAAELLSAADDVPDDTDGGEEDEDYAGVVHAYGSDGDGGGHAEKDDC